jgi:hypothetical protein
VDLSWTKVEIDVVQGADSRVRLGDAAELNKRDRARGVFMHLTLSKGGTDRFEFVPVTGDIESHCPG